MLEIYTRNESQNLNISFVRLNLENHSTAIDDLVGLFVGGQLLLSDFNTNFFPQQVNHSPSFSTDSKLDREIKDSLIFDSLRLMNFSQCDRKKCIEEERRKVRERLLQKPKGKDHKYAFYIHPTILLMRFVIHSKILLCFICLKMKQSSQVDQIFFSRAW